MAEEDRGQESCEHRRSPSVNPSPVPENIPDNSYLINLIDDDVYGALQRHFYMSGKGRRPDLPKGLTVTRRLLVQLFFLKEEGQESFKTLKSWLEKLVPSSATVTEGRIKHRIHTILESSRQLPKAEIFPYLQQEHDFHALAEPLALLGLNRLHLINVKSFDEQPAQTVSNNVVVCLEQFRAQEQQPATFVTKWLRALSISCTSLTDKQLKDKIRSVVVRAKTLSKNKSNESALNYFLQNGFPTSETSTSTTTSSGTCHKCTDRERVLKTKEKTIRDLESDNARLKKIVADLESQINIKDNVISDIKTLNEENCHLETCLKEAKCSLKKICAENEKIQEERDKMNKSNCYKTNQQQKLEISELTAEINFLKEPLKLERSNYSKLEPSIDALKEKIKEEQSLKSYYKSMLNKEKQQNVEFKKMLSYDSESVDKVKLREEGSSHRYSDDIRKTFYALQGEANVSAINCSKVVETVSKYLFKVDLEGKLPSDTSSINFSNEAHIVAKSQIVDEIKNSDHFTYACDGTSRQKASYVEQHIILSNGKQLSLGFTEVASEDSDTLLNKCVDAFKEIVQMHCLTEEIEGDEARDKLLKEVIKKMKGLMSDRAAVMKAFDQKMHEFKIDLLGSEATSTHFLFCNAHFLLALSSASQDAVKVSELESTVDQVKLGRDSNPKFSRFAGASECATLRAIRTSAEVFGPRGDEKNGCRQNWLAFCSTKSKQSMFTSYRANRFNNLFQNATALLYHKDDIGEFLNEFNSHDNLKLQSVLDDVMDKRVILNVAVLSFLHVFLTEPYWKLMDSSKSYADFPLYVKKLYATLCEWGSDDYDPKQSISVFEDFPSGDLYATVISNFLSDCDYDAKAFKLCLKEVCGKCEIALKRQLSDFLDGGVFGGEMDDSVLEVLKTCPLTNLTGERLFGDFDYCINVRRNASLFLRSTRNMWKHNKTEKFLFRQSDSKSKKLLKNAIKYGPEFKRRSKIMREKIIELRKAKGAEQKRKKNEQAIKVLERKKSALDAVLARGSSIVTNKDELDNVYCGPKALERLKEQVRFRNLVAGEKIKLTGTKKELYERLLHQISEGSSGDV